MATGGEASIHPWKFVSGACGPGVSNRGIDRLTRLPSGSLPWKLVSEQCLGDAWPGESDEIEGAHGISRQHQARIIPRLELLASGGKCYKTVRFGQGHRDTRPSGFPRHLFTLSGDGEDCKWF